ncbi:MAG TPA: PP2C family protein-serine/threonine phosphatase [Acidimicrobiales bacterium]|nr:PP2C family protein-serine/threonine phosphatase [Acidimicrobiales bacterium]
MTTEACWWAADDGGGGDFFEVAALAGGRVGMVIGDAPGSGARAARLGSRLGNGARGLLGAGTPAGALLEALDGIVQDAGVDLIATALCVVIDARAGKAELTSAGHLPGLRVALHGVGELLYPNRYPPLGITATRSASRYDFGWDDGMYLFTDGMVERHQISIDAGLGALTRASAGLSGAMASAPELARRTTQRLGRPQDDAMVVSLRLNARPALDRG